MLRVPSKGFANVAMVEGAPALLSELHGKCLQLSCGRTSRRFEGLASASRWLRAQGVGLVNKKHKKLLKDMIALDVVVAWNRHATQPLCDGMLQQLMAVVSSLPSTEAAFGLASRLPEPEEEGHSQCPIEGSSYDETSNSHMSEFQVHDVRFDEFENHEGELKAQYFDLSEGDKHSRDVAVQTSHQAGTPARHEVFTQTGATLVNTVMSSDPCMLLDAITNLAVQQLGLETSSRAVLLDQRLFEDGQCDATGCDGDRTRHQCEAAGRLSLRSPHLPTRKSKDASWPRPKPGPGASRLRPVPSGRSIFWPRRGKRV